ncbi:ATP-dependent Clp protease, protease subunit [Promicromonospora umidemergens]|uniref:ATP-dependent Clp protease proteolytic subunit n=1 Tax=Promicromonospora umidemergens TaxID=629679 RepID=A0ABP8WC97_9MICO|nr:ATP-dependent Clp protease proteolytic subunit [Promicromonospora umidemergens]MCP2284379.1 ATP-dependent Clp protease, protease subunit [Promicromonospora umidemergens]
MTETSHSQPFDDHLATRLLHQRIVLIGTEIDDAVANRVTSQLLLLSAEDSGADISIYINSPGGSISAGLAVFDTMKLLPNAVSTVAVGFAGSMGQFLLAAGTKGKRYALPHARIMMHQPSGGVGGTTADVVIQAENIRHVKDLMIRLQSEHTGQPADTVAADSERDRWFTAEQALAYGMVDKIVDQVNDVRPGGRRRAGL